jgi:hypothetical protein
VAVVLPNRCVFCGAILMGGATVHDPACVVAEMVRDVLERKETDVQRVLRYEFSGQVTLPDGQRHDVKVVATEDDDDSDWVVMEFQGVKLAVEVSELKEFIEQYDNDH